MSAAGARAPVIAGVVLAAGLSRRMGRAKLLLPLQGRPVVRHVAERLLSAGLGRVLVVAGRERAGIEAALAGLPIELVVNPNPEAGQAGSVVAGVAALPAGTQGALIALGDQPFLPEGLIPALVDAFVRTNKAIAAPQYRDGLGNPVLFRASVFPELLSLTGDRGARGVVERDAERVALVHCDAAMPRDLDTPDEYERLRSPGPGEAPIT